MKETFKWSIAIAGTSSIPPFQCPLSSFSHSLKILFVLIFFGCGCTTQEIVPTSKSDYLIRFDEFTLQVSMNCANYSEYEMTKLDKAYVKISRTWYNKFYDELTSEEVLLIWSFKARYIKCKLGREFKQQGKGLYEQFEDTFLVAE